MNYHACPRCKNNFANAVPLTHNTNGTTEPENGFPCMAPNTVVKLSIVKFQGGNYRVTAIHAKKQTCNLGAVFGKGVPHKNVPLADVVEDEAEWTKRWQASESYACA